MYGTSLYKEVPLLYGGQRRASGLLKCPLRMMLEGTKTDAHKDMGLETTKVENKKNRIVPAKAL